MGSDLLLGEIFNFAKYVGCLVTMFVCLLLGEIYDFVKYVTCLVTVFVSLFVCLFVCLFTKYRPQFWRNHLQIFFLSRYPWPAELAKILSKSVDGIRSKKIPENPKNPYLSSLQKFQKFISQLKLIRINSYLQETCIGSICTFKKYLTLKGQTSRSWQGKMCSNFNALYLKNYWTDFVQIFFVGTYGQVLLGCGIKSRANIHVFAWKIAKIWKTPILFIMALAVISDKIAKIGLFETVVARLFMGRSEWYSYQKKGKNL